MNQPQCAVIARRGCRTAETEGRVATHPSWTKASLFPPSVRRSGRHELTLGTAQEQFIMGVTEKKTHRAQLSMAMAARLNSEALFLRAGTQSLVT